MEPQRADKNLGCVEDGVKHVLKLTDVGPYRGVEVVHSNGVVEQHGAGGLWVDAWGAPEDHIKLCPFLVKTGLHCSKQEEPIV